VDPRGCLQGSSVPQVFIPKLIELWQQGCLPVQKLTKSYGFDDINEGFEDSVSGRVLKPVLVI